jgi:acetyl-CoA C-acetyltransferase
MKKAFIYDAIRTPRGRAKADGGLADLTPFELLKTLYDALEQRTHLDRNRVEDVVLGCVTQVGEQGGNIAKASLLYAGWPDHVPGLTVNRYCSSGIDAINIAAMKVMTGQAQCTIAGGIEMMSRVPMLSDKATLFSDSAQALRHRMLMMGSGADLIASLFDMSRQQVDEVAFKSQQRAAYAREQGWFSSIIPIFNPVKDIMVNMDECVREAISMDELDALKPFFADIGAQGVDALQCQEHPELEAIRHVHTAGNSPAMADAASLILIGDESLSETLGQPPRAKIVAMATVCDDPLEVVSGCAKATATLMRQHNLKASDIDLFELHEAFAATSIKCQLTLGIGDEKLNVNGGCIALGHPMGATGGIMMGTLLDELERRKSTTGIVAASGAAGSGTAILIQCV